MTLEHVLHFLHVLGWVCWLGTDLGVFLGSRASENPQYSVDTRMALLDLVLKIDKIPRLCPPVIFITGIYLSHQYGVTVIPLTLGLVLGLTWLAVAYVAVTNHPTTSLGKAAALSNMLGSAGVLFGMGGLALMSLLGTETMPNWLAVKWLAFAWTALFSISIDFAVQPMVKNYMRLQAEGGTDEVNTALSSSLKKVYGIVFCIYFGTIVAAYFGLNKLF